jgi:hypothetical protein
MTQDITQLTVDIAPSTINGSESDILRSGDVISLVERRLQSEPHAPDRKSLIVLTEPRQTLIGRKWGAAPKGTPIWGCFTMRMSQEEILAHYPFLERSPRSLVGSCKLFGEDAKLYCRFDHRGGLDELLIAVECEHKEAAARRFSDLVHLWESELFPVDTLWFNDERAIIQKDNLQVHMTSFRGDPTPVVYLEITAVKPKGRRTEALSNVISFHRESA